MKDLVRRKTLSERTPDQAEVEVLERELEADVSGQSPTAVVLSVELALQGEVRTRELTSRSFGNDAAFRDATEPLPNKESMAQTLAETLSAISNLTKVSSTHPSRPGAWCPSPS